MVLYCLIMSCIHCLESDKYCEAESPITWVRDAAVKVRYGKSVMESMNSVTVMSLVKSTIRKHPNARALGTSFTDIFSSCCKNVSSSLLAAVVSYKPLL